MRAPTQRTQSGSNGAGVDARGEWPLWIDPGEGGQPNGRYRR
jgi:hypothetical protein